MSQRSDLLAAFALIALSLSVPAALAAWLLATPVHSSVRALAPLAGEALPVAQDPAGVEAEPASARAPRPGAGPPVPVMGVLYTRGTATVDWNGVAIPVENGTYAYVGGETVTVGGQSIAVLRLDDGSSVFVCPDGAASLEHERDGSYTLKALTGSSRFLFAPGRAFSVEANGLDIGPPPGASGTAHVGEVVASPDGGGLLCSLGGALSVSGGASAPAGTMVRTSPGAASGVSVVDIPAAFASAHGSGNQAIAGAGDMPYLCRCQEIDRHARGEGAPADPGAPPAPPSAQASTVPSGPPVEPPTLPALALAEPGAPDPFDPNVLPPPAAGPGEEGALSVPPPLVPSGGSGGGASISRS